MPLAHKLILGFSIAGFITLPTVLFWTWIRTRAWRYGPMGLPSEDNQTSLGSLDQDQGEPRRKAA